MDLKSFLPCCGAFIESSLLLFVLLKEGQRAFETQHRVPVKISNVVKLRARLQQAAGKLPSQIRRL